MKMSPEQLARVKAMGQANRTHGFSYDGLYATWKAMIRRCRDANYHSYKNYGARGVKVCERWLQIDNFAADMGPRPKGTTLDRIDVDGDYEPTNCRWLSNRQQMNNTRSNVRFTLDGRTQTVHEWATELGVSPRTLATRRNLGWDDHRVLTTPVNKRLSRWKSGDKPNPHGSKGARNTRAA